MKNRTLITRLFFAFAFISICKATYFSLLPHQLLSPVLTSPMADNTYWLAYYLGIPQMILNNHTIGVLFALLLLTTPILGFIYPSKIVFARFFCFLFFMLFLTSNAFHGHGWVAILISSFLFCTKKDDNFILVFNAIRYYVAFVFLSASLWKIFRGSVFVNDIMVEILKLQHLSTLIENPTGNYSKFILFLIESPYLSQALFYTAILIQFSFIIAFKTKKYDRYLLALFFIFFFGDWVVMGIPFFEFYIFGMFLFPWSNLEKEYQQFRA